MVTAELIPAVVLQSSAKGMDPFHGNVPFSARRHF
jgi:hypothetical protein